MSARLRTARSIASLFIFFMSFALNQRLQYRQVGRWTDYAYGEKVC